MSTNIMKRAIDKFIGLFKTKSTEDAGKDSRKLKDIIEDAHLHYLKGCPTVPDLKEDAVEDATLALYMESIILYVLRGDGSLTSVVQAAKWIKDHLFQRKEDVIISCERIRRSIAKRSHPDVVEMWIYFESIITAKTDIGNYNYIEELNAWSPIIRIHSFLRSRRDDRQDYIDGGILDRFRTADYLVTQRTGEYQVERPRRTRFRISEPTHEEIAREKSKRNNCAACCEDYRVLERRKWTALHGHGNHDPLWLQNVNQCPYCKDMWDENHKYKVVDVEPEWWFLSN